MKVFKFQFYRLPFTYEQEDRFYKEEHVNIYKINWNSDNVNNQISWDFTDPLNPKIRVVGKLIGYKNNVLVEAENDFNYCYVEYGENPSKLMKQYFFTIPIKRLSFNAYEYVLKLDVIMTYWNKFYDKYKNNQFSIQRASLKHFRENSSYPSMYGVMAYMNSEFEDVHYSGNHNYFNICPNMGIEFFEEERPFYFQLKWDKPQPYCIYNINSNNIDSIVEYIPEFYKYRYTKDKLKDLVNNGAPCYVFVDMSCGKIYKNMSYVLRTTLFPTIEFEDKVSYNNVFRMLPVKREYEIGQSLMTIHPISNYPGESIRIELMKFDIQTYNYYDMSSSNKYKSFFEIIKIRNWCLWDDMKKEVITKWTTKFWPHYGTTSFKYIVSINSDTLEIRSAFQDSSVDNGLVIYWDITYPTSYSFPKIEEYMRENRNQIDNARAIGDQAIKLSQWERNTAAAGHVEGMVRGGLSGAGTGALIGSIVPGIGTAIGGVVGAIGGALTGGAISGGFNAYGVGNTKIDIAKLERQSIEAKLRDVKNQNPILKNNSNDYTNYMKSSSFRIYIRKNTLEDVMYDVFFNYYNRFGSKYNIRINMNEIIENNKRKYWYFIQTENMYKDLDDYFPTYIKNELSNVFDNGVRLHHTLENKQLNLYLFNQES